MSLQKENRDWPEVGSANDKVDYQRFEHQPIDVLQFIPDNDHGVDVPIGTNYKASVRIYCPDIRVVSRLACVFEPASIDARSAYNLSTVTNDIVAFSCINSKSRIARVGEIIGKNGVPYVFPKSNIDGIAFETELDMPWIDVDMHLAFPGVAGSWVFYYHATSNNKLKRDEWQGYISRVTMSLQDSPKTIRFIAGG